MTLSPWILVTFISLSFLVAQARANYPKAEIKNRFQLVVDDERSQNYTITLDGSMSTGADRYRWTEVEKPRLAASPEFSAPRHAITNVTIANQEGMYQFKLRASTSPSLDKSHSRRLKHDDAFSKVYVEKPSSVGMHLFASTIVNRLLKMQYQYIALSQYHMRSGHYHPNVAEYFRELAKDRGSMLDQVTQHVLAKQATEDLINSCPTDYVAVMMSQGFIHRIHYNANVTEFMTSGFEIAQESEAELAREMALVVHHAERNRDNELSEFVAADLLPRVTKVMNGHKNHLETTLRPVDNSPALQRHLVEFLFDKYLKI